MSGGGFSSYNLPSNTISLSYKKSTSVTINGSGAILILEENSNSGLNLTSVSIDGKTTFDNCGVGTLIYFTSKAVVNFYNYNVETSVAASNFFGYYLY